MDHAAARARMVEQHIASRKINDARVLEAMAQVPRHLFIPENNRDLCYRDGPVGIGRGQTISQPYLVALMSQLLVVGPGTKVLEIGTGSGYQAAVLAHMGATVYSVEILQDIAEGAAQTLAENGYGQVKLKLADGLYGWEEAMPFDRIIVTAAPAQIPHPLPQQLRIGGFMLVPTGDRRQQTLYRYTRRELEWAQESLAPVLFVPMTGDVSEG
jgi:protein-L-isoaspartate(D-aspartate) O-methyltransferase